MSTEQTLSLNIEEHLYGFILQPHIVINHWLLTLNKIWKINHNIIVFTSDIYTIYLLYIKVNKWKWLLCDETHFIYRYVIMIVICTLIIIKKKKYNSIYR